MKKNYSELQQEWEWNIPREFNIGKDCTDKHSQKSTHHNKTALIWENEDGTSGNITYTQLSSVTNKVANMLNRLGLSKGDRLVLRLGNIPEFVYIFLGATKTGIIPIPTSTLLTTEELQFIVSDSGAKCLVTSPEYYEQVDNMRTGHNIPGIVILIGQRSLSGCRQYHEELKNVDDSPVEVTTRAEDPGYICYTSGTTGYPKGVVHAQRSVIGHDPSAMYWQCLKNDTTVFHAGRLNWTYTLGTGCLDPLRHGCTAVIYQGGHNPKRYFDILEKYKVNVFMAVPTVYRHMLRISDEVSSDLSSVTHGLSAGEHLSEELYNNWVMKQPFKLYDGLGMSEFSYYVSNSPLFEVKPGSPGRPQPGHRSLLIDNNGNVAETGQMGVLATDRKDPGIMLGYWNRPEDTSAMFNDNMFISGDYFYSDHDGYFWLLGREDDIITSFGYRISPFEVERVLIQHDTVADCAVAGIKVGEDKTIVSAFIEKSHNSDEERIIKSISEFLSKHLANYKLPKQYYFVDSIPRTINGKIKRSALREHYSSV